MSAAAAKRARAGGGSVARHPPAPPADAAGDPAALQAYHHTVYFDSYAHLAIHQEMLRDEARTLAYRDALKACADDIRGKVVLDVGAGTGVLSSACPRVGRGLRAVRAQRLRILTCRVPPQSLPHAPARAACTLSRPARWRSRRARWWPPTA